LEALKKAPSTERANGAWKTFLDEKTRSEEEGKAPMAMAMAMVFLLRLRLLLLLLQGFENARN
jgi:hypothetical protein